MISVKCLVLSVCFYHDWTLLNCEVHDPAAFERRERLRQSENVEAGFNRLGVEKGNVNRRPHGTPSKYVDGFTCARFSIQMIDRVVSHSLCTIAPAF